MTVKELKEKLELLDENSKIRIDVNEEWDTTSAMLANVKLSTSGKTVILVGEI